MLQLKNLRENKDDILYSQKSRTNIFTPVNEQQELHAINNKLNAEKVDDPPKLNNQPINEYQIPFIATLQSIPFSLIIELLMG